MNAFPFDIKKALVIAFIIALPLLSVNVRRDGQPALYERPIHFVAGAVQSAYTGFATTIFDTVNTYTNLVNVKKGQRLLIDEQEGLRLKLLEFDEIKKENERLNQLLSFQQKHTLSMVAARLIGTDLFGEHSTIRINKGYRDSVIKGQAVVTTQGAVGHVLHSNMNSAIVLLITDHYSVLDGIVQRSRARGIVAGKSHDSAELKYLQRSDDVQVGDIILTSGLDNIFPKGYPIARVTNIEKKKISITQVVTLEPIVSPTKIEEVFVITNANHEDFSPKFIEVPDGIRAPDYPTHQSKDVEPSKKVEIHTGKKKL